MNDTKLGEKEPLNIILNIFYDKSFLLPTTRRQGLYRYYIHKSLGKYWRSLHHLSHASTQHKVIFTLFWWLRKNVNSHENDLCSAFYVGEYKICDIYGIDWVNLKWNKNITSLTFNLCVIILRITPSYPYLLKLAKFFLVRMIVPNIKVNKPFLFNSHTCNQKIRIKNALLHIKRHTQEKQTLRAITNIVNLVYTQKLLIITQMLV